MGLLGGWVCNSHTDAYRWKAFVSVNEWKLLRHVLWSRSSPRGNTHIRDVMEKSQSLQSTQSPRISCKPNAVELETHARGPHQVRLHGSYIDHILLTLRWRASVSARPDRASLGTIMTDRRMNITFRWLESNEYIISMPFWKEPRYMSVLFMGVWIGCGFEMRTALHYGYFITNQTSTKHYIDYNQAGSNMSNA